VRDVKPLLPFTSMLLSASAGWSLAQACADPAGRCLFALAGGLALSVVVFIAVRAIREFKTFRRAYHELKALTIKLKRAGDDFEGKPEVEERVKAAQEVIRKYFEP
jgi:hypothetical protein